MNNLRALVILLTAVVAASNLHAQPSRPEELTLQSAKAAANILSNRAIAAVNRLDFGTYKGNAGVLIAEGDSWFDYQFFDVLQHLEGRYHYKVESTAHKGDTLESIVYDEGQLAGVALKMKRLADTGLTPVAILLSGGGNDVSGPELALLLNHAQSGLPTLNERIVAGVLDVRVRAGYLTLIQSINNLSQLYFKRTVPILIHGYDYPVPDGRGFLGGWGFLPGPWFKPYFQQKGYAAQSDNAATLRVLVNRFNAMLEAIPREPGYGNVCYVKVAGTLSTSTTTPRQYESDWGNELHPTSSGFAMVAGQFQRVLESCAKSVR